MPLPGLPDRVRVAEDLLELFERAAFGLGDRDPHGEPPHCMEDEEDGVLLPADVAERDRRGVGIDEARQPRHEVLEGHALGADLVVEHLCRVQGLQRRPREGPEYAVQEDHGDEGVAGPVSNVPVGLCCEHVDRYVGKYRQGGAPEEELPSPELVNREAACNATEEAEHRVERVQQKLLVRTCDPHVLQDRWHVVADDCSADELRKGHHKHYQPDPVQG